MSNSREGLPPCMIRYSKLGESIAFIHDYKICNLLTGTVALARFSVNTGVASDVAPHPFGGLRVGETFFTFDPAEAQAAFERGAEWVRTGEIYSGS